MATSAPMHFPNQEKITTVSAPGKVLVAGGYLVLDREFSGLVIGTTARFKTTISTRLASDSHSGSHIDQAGPPIVKVISPQFTDGLWQYYLHVREGDATAFDQNVNDTVACPHPHRICSLVPMNGVDQKPNQYVEYTLTHTLTIISGLVTDFENMIQSGLDIVIQGDNDFYSQREQLMRQGLPLKTESLKSLTPYSSTLGTISNVHKTGLGSSAAMITSLVGALMSHFGLIALPNDKDNHDNILYREGKNWVHNVAQFTHCLAQGKIGSGFDISAAVFGSHRYQRFDGDVIKELLEKSADIRAFELIRILRPLLHVEVNDNRWNQSVIKFELPPNLCLMLADIDAGSSTPKLVSGILSWRASQPAEANPIWEKLHHYNAKLEALLRQLRIYSNSMPNLYKDAVNYCSNICSSEWDSSSNPVISDICNVADTFLSIRSMLRRMSELSGIPVEPPTQTKLLDECMKVPGVIMAGVPGAGGFDAIFAVVIEKSIDANGKPSSHNRSKVETIWQELNEKGISACPLLSEESSCGILCS